MEYHRVYSALGSLLFLIYMNTLRSQLTDGLLLQHADVTTVICSGITTASVQTTMCSQLSNTTMDSTEQKEKNLLSCGLESQGFHILLYLLMVLI